MVLIYDGPRLPPQLKDTGLVILSVCDQYGLQHVTWVSRKLSRAAVVLKFLQIYEEGAKRHGEADEGDLNRGTAEWSRERIAMRIDNGEQDGYRVTMISDGPGFHRCEAGHQ